MCVKVAASKLQHKIDEESRKINRTIIFVGFNILTLYYSFLFKTYYPYYLFHTMQLMIIRFILFLNNHYNDINDRFSILTSKRIKMQRQNKHCSKSFLGVSFFSSSTVLHEASKRPKILSFQNIYVYLTL